MMSSTEKNPDNDKVQHSMDVLEKELLKFSNDIRLQDDITIIEVRYASQNASGYPPPMTIIT